MEATKISAAHKRHDLPNYIETASGRRFHLDDPTFAIHDIAHSLGQHVRFGGQGKKFYSVAEHSVLVATIMRLANLGDPLEGLLHDAEEAYLGDMPSPIKYQLPDFLALSDRLQRRLRTQFSLPPAKTAGCHEADKMAGFIEAAELMTSQGGEQLVAGDEYMTDLRRRALEMVVPYHLHLKYWSPSVARDKFFVAFCALRHA